jgi:hypothetical protein
VRQGVIERASSGIELLSHPIETVVAFAASAALYTALINARPTPPPRIDK